MARSIKKYKKVLELLDESLSDLQSCIGKDRSQSTYDNYFYYRNYISDFITCKYHVSDIVIGSLEPKFIERFSNYLSLDPGLRSGTIVGVIIRLKWVTKYAHDKGRITMIRSANLSIIRSFGSGISSPRRNLLGW